MKRGLTYAEAMDYVGAKRKTFDEQWRPRLVAFQQGSSHIYDREDLDKLFDQFKQEAAGSPPAANDDVQTSAAQNGARNGRPITEKGRKTWANKQGVSTKTETSGRSTSGTAESAFASAVFSIKRKRKAG